MLAERMPSEMLRRAVCAIGYRADFDTGVTSDWPLRNMAAASRKHDNLGGSYRISHAQLAAAVKLLKQAGVLTVTRQPYVNGKRAPSVYALDLDYFDDGTLAALDFDYRVDEALRKRQEREAGKVMAPPVASVTGGPIGGPKDRLQELYEMPPVCLTKEQREERDRLVSERKRRRESWRE